MFKKLLVAGLFAIVIAAADAAGRESVTQWVAKQFKPAKDEEDDMVEVEETTTTTCRYMTKKRPPEPPPNQ